MNRFREVKIASIVGIIGNLFLLIIKSIIGIISNSQAMIADAFNSAGDIFSSFMTFIGNKIASTPSDDDHNLGHGKAEYIYSLLISIVMILMTITIFKNSFSSILNGSKYTFSIWLIIVCLTTMIVKASLYLYTNSISKKCNNLLIKANSKDHRNDFFITTLNLISVIFAENNFYLLDGIVGIGIAIWILITAINIFKESYDVLMDKSISSDFTIYVDGNLSTFKSHDIANKLEKEIVKELDEIYLTVIHVNPMKISVKKYNNKRKKLIDSK